MGFMVFACLVGLLGALWPLFDGSEHGCVARDGVSLHDQVYLFYAEIR